MTHESFGAGAARVVARLAKQVERALAEVDLSLAQYRLIGNLGRTSGYRMHVGEVAALARPGCGRKPSSDLLVDVVLSEMRRRSVMRVT